MGLALLAARSNMYDVVFPDYAPPAECTLGCLPWTAAGAAATGTNVTQLEVDAWWFNATEQRAAGSACAIPGANTGYAGAKGPAALGAAAAPPSAADVATAFAGPFCVCAPTATSAGGVRAFCTPPLHTPEQINLQLASHDVVVAAFVSYHNAPPPAAAAPQAELGLSPGALTTTLAGVAHHYREPLAPSASETGRNYTMSFVRFGGLAPRTRYYYRVKGPAAADRWSALRSFRSAYSGAADGAAGAETRIAIFGDVAVARYNNFANLEADCATGRVDAIVVMGDHAYDLGGTDDRRGDAYMNAFGRTLGSCPWVPIVGNHEALDGDHYNRYRNQTWGELLGQQNASSSTATSALGHLLTKGLRLGAGAHGSSAAGARPSGTSRYFSVDIGLIHVVGLDLNDVHLPGQLEWLEADLAAAHANRAAVPWLVVTSHFPIYLASDAGSAAPDAGSAPGGGSIAERSSAAWWASNEDEVHLADEAGTWRSCAENGEEEGCTSVAEQLRLLASPLEPLLVRYQVDIYDAGHSHLYGVSWPMVNGTRTQTNYSGPWSGTVYVTEGNGGVPGVPAAHHFKKPASPFMRIGATGGAYGRMITSNASVLTYEHVWNNGGDGRDGEVMETWAIVRS